MHHIFRCSVCAGDGRQFDIRPAAVYLKNLAYRNADVLGKSTVKVGCHPDVFQRTEAVQPHASPNQNPSADFRSCDIIAMRNYFSATVGSLNQGERSFFIPTAVLPLGIMSGC